MKVGLGQKLEHVLTDRQGHHFVRPARLLTGKHGNGRQAHDQNDHLHEVGHSHRPHAAKQGVGQNRDHANGHAQRHADGAARQQVEHQTQGRDLR